MGSAFKAPVVHPSAPVVANTTRALDRQRALGLPAPRAEAATAPQAKTPAEGGAAASATKRAPDSISPYHPKVQGDAQFIRVCILRGVDSPQQAEAVVALLSSYEVWDNTLAVSNPEHGYGNLDAMFTALGNLAAIDDGTIFTRYRLPTDILWFDLAEPWRDQYRRLYGLTTFGTHRKPDEGKNYGKEMAKQEAIGVLGILKGVAVSAAGLIDDARFVLPGPNNDPAWASKAASATFDDAAKWWVGEDWEHGESVLLGLSAAEIGETGGTLVFTLATLEVKALTVTQSILMYPAMARSIDGALDRLGKVYLEDRDAARSAASDPRLWQEVVGIAGSILGLLLSKTASGQRIGTKLAHFLLDAAPIAPIVGKIIEALLSADPPETKRRAIGLALAELLQMAAAIAGGRLRNQKVGGGTKGQGQPPKSGEKPPAQPEKKAPPPEVEDKAPAPAPATEEKAPAFGPKGSWIGPPEESEAGPPPFTAEERAEAFGPRGASLGTEVAQETGPPPFSDKERAEAFGPRRDYIGPNRVPNEPPMRFTPEGEVARPAPPTEAEREITWKLLGDETGQGKPGTGSYTDVPSKRLWKTPAPETFGPGGTAEFTEPIEFSQTGAEKVTVRSTQADPRERVSRIEVPEIEKLAQRSRDPEVQTKIDAERNPYGDVKSPYGEAYHRALKAGGLGGHDFNKQGGHIVPKAIGGATLAYNLDPMTKNYNEKRRVQAERMLAKFLKKTTLKNLTLVIERNFDQKSQLASERFVVYQPATGNEPPKAAFDLTVKVRGTVLVGPDAPAPPTKSKAAAKAKPGTVASPTPTPTTAAPKPTTAGPLTPAPTAAEKAKHEVTTPTTPAKVKPPTGKTKPKSGKKKPDDT